MLKINVYIGAIDSGKTYQSNKDCDAVIGFADELKESVWKMIDWRPETEEKLEEFKSNEIFLSDYPRVLTGREIFQIYGSKVRKKDKNFWVKTLTKKLDSYLIFDKLFLAEDITKIGIADCRYENEIVSLISWGRKNKCDVTFIHTDFKSNRYCVSSSHESEKLAQEFAGKVYPDFDKMIKERFTDK